MKRLSAFLVLALVACNALAQSPPFDQKVVMKRERLLMNWLQTVRAAESKYKADHGVYGDLTALRKAHLLDSLVFESDKPTDRGPDTNFVPDNTQFEVTVSSDGKHYQVSISEAITGEWTIGVSGDEKREGVPWTRRDPPETWGATPT